MERREDEPHGEPPYALEREREEEMEEGSGPKSLLRLAVKADPANRFFLGVIAAAVAGSTILKAYHDQRAALITSMLVLEGAVVLAIFSWLTRHAHSAFRLPALTLLWVSNIGFIASVILVFTSGFFDWPLHWKVWLEPLVHPPAIEHPHRDVTGGTGPGHVPIPGVARTDPNPHVRGMRHGSGSAVRHAVAVAPAAAPLTIEGAAVRRVPFASHFEERLTASGGSGTLSWTLPEAAAGLAIDADGRLTGTVAADGGRQVTVQVSDARHTQARLTLTLTPFLTVCEDRRADGVGNNMLAGISRHIAERTGGMEVVQAGECGGRWRNSEERLIVDCKDCAAEQSYLVAELRRGPVPFQQTYKVPIGADPDRIAQDMMAHYQGDLLQHFVAAGRN